MSYIDFNDDRIPIGKRKKAYIAYLISKHGYELIKAQQCANKRFGFEIKYPKLVFIYADHGRFCQNSYMGLSEVSMPFSDMTKRAGRIEYHEVDNIYTTEAEQLRQKYKADGYEVVMTEIVA